MRKAKDKKAKEAAKQDAAAAVGEEEAVGAVAQADTTKSFWKRASDKVGLTRD